MRQAKEGTRMPTQARTSQRPSRCVLLVGPAIAAALALLVAFVAAVLEPSASAWSLLRLVALLAAGWIPIRLAREAAAYCAEDAGRPKDRAVRVANRSSGVLDVPAVSTHSFGRALAPGREALPSGSTHI
ncbi:hypothetical protein Caci_4034 [Catenulispora acidiphila DSM 44928]|uniref:Uncharacterized protein n=2 Tax=Catenulispora TaxID=414878 RepID=C7QG57_CATAD|nr:hypothetical protein Caci_4034 [Catenulispora acidiphila DSM 44928]